MALMTLCKCGKKIPIQNKRCNACEEVHVRDELIRKRKGYIKYNEKREPEVRNFYGSKPWKRVREAVKRRDKGLCLVCVFNYKYNFMDCVHHIVPYKKDKALALDINNLVCLCEECHSQIHELYDKGFITDVQKELKSLIKDRGY